MCQRQFTDNLTANPCFFLRQHPENADASRMANRLGELRKFVIGFGTFKSLEFRLRLRLNRKRSMRGLASNLFCSHSIRYARAHLVKRSPHVPLALWPSKQAPQPLRGSCRTSVAGRSGTCHTNNRRARSGRTTVLHTGHCVVTGSLITRACSGHSAAEQWWQRATASRLLPTAGIRNKP